MAGRAGLSQAPGIISVEICASSGCCWPPAPTAAGMVHRRTQPLPPDAIFHQVEVESAAGAHFLSPPDGAVYRLSSGVERDAQRLLVEIAGAEPKQPVTLWIDGQPVYTFSDAPYEFWWTLEAGRHTFSLRVTSSDSSQVASDSITLEVK
jgi:hypothetical protein